MKGRTLSLAIVLGLLAAGCNETSQQSGSASSQSTSTSTGATSTPAPAGEGGRMHKLASGLQYEDLVVGSGKMAEPGMNVAMLYTGWLTDGTKFDGNVDSGKPLRFQLGSGTVIQGWEEGIKGMRIGGKRKLTIPPDLGYGARGYPGVIPPNATLLFEVELVDVQ